MNGQFVSNHFQQVNQVLIKIMWVVLAVWGLFAIAGRLFAASALWQVPVSMAVLIGLATLGTVICTVLTYVDTVGRNKKVIEEYIKKQLEEDIISDQISIKEYFDPFTGETQEKNKKK